MADEDKKEEEPSADATSLFPFKVKIQGYGTVTPPAATTDKEQDNG